ncbi:MAG: sugar ABC transporter permease [Nocardioides sp.]
MSETNTAVAADLLDERLIANQGLSGYLSAGLNRLKGGDLGSLPVVIGLVVISIVFYAIEPRFLSSFTLTNIFAFAAPIGLISLGIVLVLLLGEIDLSVGSVSGLAAASMAVLVVNKGWGVTAAFGAALLVGLAIGAGYAWLYTTIGVPSFVFSLAGLLAFQGGLLYVLGSQGTINLPNDSWLVQFARFKFLTGGPAYLVALGVAVIYVLAGIYGSRRRAAAELSTEPIALLFVKGALLAVGLLALTWYIQQGQGRGWSYLVLLFAALVVLMDLALRKTTWGRHVFAVGGNVEAARRAGIKVNRVYYSVFGLCSMFAALGGLMVAGQLTSVSQASGTTDTNLTAIAAAVIGGTSLFGGRGSAYSAMLGIVVLQAIQSGLNIIGVDSSVRFIVTGGVLLLATIIDSLSRRRRSSSGRG